MTLLRRPSVAALLATPLVLAGCQKHAGNPAPPKVETPADLPNETSRIVVPLSADLGNLERALDAEAPRELWHIDQHQDDCVKAKRVDIGIAKVKVVPNLGCRIVGQVTRGRIVVTGRGDTLFITFPVNAQIAAKDVGGIASKTATGSATIHAIARLSMVGNWQPSAKVDIQYDWREAPGVDFLGKRITFVDKADERLRPVVAKLEQTLPRELAKLHLREQLDGVWRQGFTVISLNKDNPPAWMRITPQKLGFGGYNVNGRRVEMTLAAEALTETFVDADRPADLVGADDQRGDHGGYLLPVFPWPAVLLHVAIPIDVYRCAQAFGFPFRGRVVCGLPLFGSRFLGVYSAPGCWSVDEFFHGHGRMGAAYRRNFRYGRWLVACRAQHGLDSAHDRFQAHCRYRMAPALKPRGILRPARSRHRAAPRRRVHQYHHRGGLFLPRVWNGAFPLYGKV